MRRTLNFRAVSLDADVDETYDGAVTRVMQVADVLGAHGHEVQVFTGVDDPDAPDEHPERDALLKLVDNWRNDALAEPNATRNGTAGQMRAEAFRECADELMTALAHLSL